MDNTLILAQEGAGFASTVTDSVSGMAGEFGLVAAAGIGIGVVLLGAQRGWRFLKSLI
jgi:hypothetical protein